MAGAVYIVANPSFGLQELAYLLLNSGVTYIIYRGLLLDITIQGGEWVSIDPDHIFVFDCC